MLAKLLCTSAVVIPVVNRLRGALFTKSTVPSTSASSSEDSFDGDTWSYTFCDLSSARDWRIVDGLVAYMAPSCWLSDSISPFSPLEQCESEPSEGDELLESEE